MHWVNRITKVTSPVQTELAHRPQDVHHTLSPQLLAQNGGGDEAASSTNTSAAEGDRDDWKAETRTPKYGCMQWYYVCTVPAVDNCRAGEGWGLVPGPFHLLHQLQERWGLVWSLLIGPRGVPVKMETALLAVALAHTQMTTGLKSLLKLCLPSPQPLAAGLLIH